MSTTSEDAFSIEFRHETVKKFVTQLLDGSIRIPNTIGMEDGNLRDFTLHFRAELLTNIGKYVSGTLRGGDLSTIEQLIFTDIACMRMIGIIEEKNPSPTHIEKEIERLHTRIDATNTLLQEVLVVLQEVVKKLD